VDGEELVEEELPEGEKLATKSPVGAIALADAIKNSGAMVTVNILGNNIGKEQLTKLQEMMKAHPTLVSLCGIADEATEANLSGLRMGAADAVILAAFAQELMAFPPLGR